MDQWDTLKKLENHGLVQIVEVAPSSKSEKVEPPNALERENAQLHSEVGRLKLENVQLKELVATLQKPAPVPRDRETCAEVKRLTRMMIDANVTTADQKPLLPPPDCRCKPCVDAAFDELCLLRTHCNNANK